MISYDSLRDKMKEKGISQYALIRRWHINPAQILPAFLIGILLAWTYYKTGSLIPCILMHVLNNSLSVYLSIKYPEAENMDDLINGTPYLIVLFGSILLFIGIILTMNHLTSQKQQ